MNFILGFIPAGYRMLALFAAVAALLVAGKVWLALDRSHQRDLGRAEVQLKWDASISEQRAQTIEAVNKARAEEHRTTAAVQKEADDARKQLAALRGSYDSAVTAGQRLRHQLAAACRGSSAPTAPAAAGGSPPADPAADLYADVQRRLEEAENATIRFADESHIAGNACERSYDALEVKP